MFTKPDLPCRTSYTLVAPKKLARAVLEEDEQPE
jgi:hypothetical protein